jgi:hypothetical protein
MFVKSGCYCRSTSALSRKCGLVESNSLYNCWADVNLKIPEKRIAEMRIKIN